MILTFENGEEEMPNYINIRESKWNKRVTKSSATIADYRSDSIMERLLFSLFTQFTHRTCRM